MNSTQQQKKQEDISSRLVQKKVEQPKEPQVQNNDIIVEKNDEVDQYDSHPLNLEMPL